jgi:Na+/proline symporter
MGGLRATFLCDYSHTLILMVIILYFMFQVYAQDSLIGSPSKMYELLKEAAIKMPVAGNKDGSYLTMKSNNALIFGVIQLCSGSGTVFLDQGKNPDCIPKRLLTYLQHIGNVQSLLVLQQQSERTYLEVSPGSQFPLALVPHSG